MTLTTDIFQNLVPGEFFLYTGKNCLKLDPGTGQQAIDLGNGTFVSGISNGTVVTPGANASVSL